MGDEQTLRLVRRLYAAALEDDLDRFLELCAPDAEWVYPAIEGIPWSGGRRGREEIAHFLELHDQEDELLELRPEEYVVQDGRGVVLGFARMRAASTGREWQTRFVHVVTAPYGKIERFEAYFDTAACVEAHRAATRVVTEPVR